jgi:hypothetical protein
MRQPVKRGKSRASSKRAATRPAGGRGRTAKRRGAKGGTGAKRIGAKRPGPKSKVRRPRQAGKPSKSVSAAGRKLKRVAKEAASAGLVAAGLTGVRAALEEFGPNKNDEPESVPTESGRPSEGNEDRHDRADDRDHA